MLQLRARTGKLCGGKGGQLVGFVAVDVMRMDRKLSYKNNVIGHIKDIYVSSADGQESIPNCWQGPKNGRGKTVHP